LLNVICLSFFAVYGSARVVALVCQGFRCVTELPLPISVLTVVIIRITCDITAIVNFRKPSSSVIYKTKFTAGQM